MLSNLFCIFQLHTIAVKWNLFSSVLGNLLYLSKHTYSVFSHVRMDVANLVHGYIPVCHFMYNLFSSERPNPPFPKPNRRKETQTTYSEDLVWWHHGGTSELQGLLVLFWANLIVFSCSSELLSCVTRIVVDHPLEAFLSGSILQACFCYSYFIIFIFIISDSHFRKTLQMRIRHQCCFYANGKNLFGFHECHRIQF